jgi:hypothetical protein
VAKIYMYVCWSTARYVLLTLLSGIMKKNIHAIPRPGVLNGNPKGWAALKMPFQQCKHQWFHWIRRGAKKQSTVLRMVL